MFLEEFRELIKRPAFSAKWLFCSYAFLVVAEFLDGLTTKIGLDLGLVEVGTYAKGVLGNYGFWGLMAWKYSIVAAVGATYLLVYYGVKKYDLARLRLVSYILIIGCLFAGIASIQVVVSNVLQIQLALHHI
ncbi:MAG: hypothetical protein ABSA75_08715 [Candidatus Bathyarchaeia archaeon]|jgi:hypothetical protein